MFPKPDEILDKVEQGRSGTFSQVFEATDAIGDGRDAGALKKDFVSKRAYQVKKSLGMPRLFRSSGSQADRSISKSKSLLLLDPSK